MDVQNVPRRAIDQVAAVLDSPEIQSFIRTLEYVRWTGRKGYPLRAMVGVCLVKSIYALPTWSRTVRLVAEHEGLQRVLGCVPSAAAVYRFAVKLRTRDDWTLSQVVDKVIAGLAAKHPEMGRDVAVDASDLPAYSNGHRSKEKRADAKYSDPDASWGHRSAVSIRGAGAFFGYKIDAAVDVATGLPLAWGVRSAKYAEQKFAVGVIDAAKRRGFGIQTAIMDKAYDSGELHFWLMQRGVAPVAPLKETATVKRGQAAPPSCEHGEWVYAGTDYKRRATKWRCPSGQCDPVSTWVRADRLHPLIPRESKRFRDLYAKRSAVEGEFGHLKNEWAMLPLRVRGLSSVKLHVDLTILARLACALARSRAAPVAA